MGSDVRHLSLVTLCAALFVAAGAVSLGAVEKSFPETIKLPNGFQPEGIEIGSGATFYVGSIPTGAVYRGSLRTGQGAVLVQPQDGRRAIGLELDQRRRLFVAGGPTGQAFVYDARTGAPIRSYSLTNEATFINDVVVTRTAAWFTDSFRPFLYRIAIGPGGRLGDAATAVPLTGDIEFADGFNVNGIDATSNGKALVIVQSNKGKLFTVDPATGRTREIALGGGDVMNGDGILLDGKTLFVVQNTQNKVAVVALTSRLDRGTIVRHITDADFDVPTTIDEFGKWLYAVNARFGTPPEPDTEYHVVQVPRR
jgi:sugar lactone lactonase YvrE